MKKMAFVITGILFTFKLFSATPAATNPPAAPQRSEEISTTEPERARPTVTVDEDTQKKWKETLDFGVSNQRIAIIHEIYNRNDPRTFPLLISILENDAEPKVRKEAVSVIRRIKYKEASASLMKQLSSDNDELRQLVITTLGLLDYQPAATKIIELLDSSVNSIKNAAITAAGDLKLKTALPKLHKLAESMETPDGIKEAAIVSIGKIGDKSSIPLLAKIFDNTAYNKFLRMYCVTALGMIGGQEVFKYIQKAFESTEFFIKLRAVEAFSRINNPESAKYLSAALRDDNEKIRLQALKAIATQPNKQQFNRQLQYMIQNENSSNVKKEAVITYIQSGGSEAMDYIKKQLEQPGNQYLKYYIILGMEKVDDATSIPLLKKLFMDNKSKELRDEIIRMLYKKNTEKAADLLKELVQIKEQENVDNLRSNQINMLNIMVRMKPEWVLDGFKKVIKDSHDIYLKIHAVRLVGSLMNNMGKSVILDLINNPASDERIQQEAIRSAGNMRFTEARSKLKEHFLKPNISQYMIYVLKAALVQLGEDGANLDAERRKVEAASRPNRTGRTAAPAPVNQAGSTGTPQPENRSPVPRTFNPGRQ